METSGNKKLTKETTKADNIIEDEVPTTKADKIEDEVVHNEVHEDPVFEETKFKKLHSWLLQLNKVLDENNGILKQLQKDRVSKEDYLAHCVAFSKSICTNNLVEADFDHLYRSLASF